MRIAIQAADLDCDRIDGTRVYILHLLRRFGAISPQDEFIIYHKKNFNPELAPPDFPNYRIKKMPWLLFWTQTRFAWEIIKDKPDCLWMPMHNIPFLLKIKLTCNFCLGKNYKSRIVVTIHDLAFKIFPDHFPKKDLWKLNFLTGLAVKYADKIIAVSESSKEDILKFYPKIKPEKIKVIHHGFDSALFDQLRNIEKEQELKIKLGIEGDYILYSGAIQPRKNLETLIQAFEIYKKKTQSRFKLVLAGEKAWMWENIVKLAQSRPVSSDIIMPGKLKFEDLGHLMRGAGVYVYPSLYEGFGITVLEAMAAGAPVICSHNSSLPEVGGNAALYFSDNAAKDLALKIEEVLSNESLRQNLISAGREQIKKFSWDKCARETLEWIKS